MAVGFGDKRSVEILLQNGAYILDEDDPIEFDAAECFDPCILQLILKYGKNAGISTEDGTICHIAIQTSNDDVVYYLIQSGENLDWSAVDEDGNNVLLLAAILDSAGILQNLVKFLKEKGLVKEMVNVKNAEGRGLLHILAEHQNETLIGYLLSQKKEIGLEEGLRDGKGRTYEDILVT